MVLGKFNSKHLIIRLIADLVLDEPWHNLWNVVIFQAVNFLDDGFC